MSERPWIIGAGGLLGSALRRQTPAPFTAAPIPWHHPSDAAQKLSGAAREYARLAPDEWCVIWAAGAGVIGMDDATAQAELEAFRLTLGAIREQLPRSRGVFFLSSSAGGLYAGSNGAPFHEATVPHPISAYGRLKLDMEVAATESLHDFCTVVIGRFSNIYGPGQNLRKSQGLISQLCRYTLTRRALNIYVPLETLRDYIYVEDAAALTLALIRRTVASADNEAVRVLASYEPASVAKLIDLINRQSHHRPLISVGVDTKASFQVRDLRMRSLFASEHEHVRRTTLGVGVATVFRSMAEQLQAGAFASETAIGR
jgi:UDP-glucose 4-epimerase